MIQKYLPAKKMGIIASDSLKIAEDDYKSFEVGIWDGFLNFKEH